jgi:hypothetical protein
MRMVRFAIHMPVPSSKSWNVRVEQGLQGPLWKTIKMNV